ncbi:MAG: hypothetical protein IT437_04640 [Phycisphaerales bacterium]|nr:hypothetical protein [Phycisphaerales bacterium]
MKTCHAIVPAGIAMLAAAVAAQPRVAIVAAANTSPSSIQFTDPQAKLMGTGLFSAVDIVSVYTGQPVPTLADLQQYDAIITWSNVNFNDSAALGDVFADYVDAGGGVVVAVFANSTTSPNRYLTGRWQSGGYEIIPGQGGNTSSPGSQTLGTILIPGHPTLDGVASFNGGTSSFRPTTTALTSHGVKVAEWSDGKTLVAVSNQFPGRVDLGMYPPSSDSSASFWVSTTDGARLMANALLVAAGAPAPCYPDCNADGQLNLSDFGCFTTKFALGDPYADCNGDGALNLSDFGCFTTKFALGCP